MIFVLAQKPPQDLNAGIRRASYAWDEHASIMAEMPSRASVNGSFNTGRARGASTTLIGTNTSAREILLNMREEIQTQMTSLFEDVNTLTSRLSSLERQISIEDEEKSGSSE